MCTHASANIQTRFVYDVGDELNQRSFTYYPGPPPLAVIGVVLVNCHQQTFASAAATRSSGKFLCTKSSHKVILYTYIQRHTSISFYTQDDFVRNFARWPAQARARLRRHACVGGEAVSVCA